MTTLLRQHLRLSGRSTKEEILKDESKLALAKAVDAEYAENRYNPAWMMAQAAYISQEVDLGFTDPTVFQGPLTFLNLNEGDKLLIRRLRGIKVYRTANGGMIDESTIRTDSQETSHEPYAWHVVDDSEDADFSYAIRLSQLVSLATQAEQVEMVRRQLALLEAATTVGSSNYVEADYTLTTLEAAVKLAIDAVADSPRPNSGITPTDVRIIGRARMVGAVSDFNSFAENPFAQEEVRRTGYIGQYRGASTVRLTNWVDGDGDSFMSAQDLWVVSDGAGEFARFGPGQVRAWTELLSGNDHYQKRGECGGYVSYPGSVYRIHDSGDSGPVG